MSQRFARILLSSLVAALLVVTALFFRSPTAHAGSNGQELQVTCSQASSIGVIGVNQYGQEVTQVFYPDTSGGSTFTTLGYWWVGDVAILWYGPSGSGRFYDSVPQQQASDIYTTDCNNPTMQYDFPTIDGAMCDPATANAEQIVVCLGNAPVYPCTAWQEQQPCMPYLDSAYITQQQSFNLYCLIGGIQTDLNLDDPANPEANMVSSPYPGTIYAGSTTYTRIWGISYMDASGWDVAQQWYPGVINLQTLTPATVPGPYYISGSMGAGFTCSSIN